MKKAQIIIEYAVLSTILITVIVLALAVTNIKGFGITSAFGIKTEGATVVVPPMTP